VRTYLDLRSEDEVLASGPPQALLDQGITWHRLAIEGYSAAAISILQPGPSEYARYYLEMLETRVGCFIEAIELIARRAALPLAFGCFAGKDRTGVLAMLLLALLDFEPEELAKDYARSAALLLARAEWFEAKWVKKRISRAQYLVRMETREETCLLFLEELRRRHGGVHEFLGRHGLSTEVQQTLRTRLRAGGPGGST
jgi:protein-tyrosine phosphatase